MQRDVKSYAGKAALMRGVEHHSSAEDVVTTGISGIKREGDEKSAAIETFVECGSWGDRRGREVRSAWMCGDGTRARAAAHHGRGQGMQAGEKIVLGPSLCCRDICSTA